MSNERCVLGTDALDALEVQYGFAHGIDGKTYVLLQEPVHTEVLPEHMVGAMAIPVLDNANIPQGEPKALLWLDAFCAGATELCEAVVLPVGQLFTADVEKTLRRMMWPKDIDRETLSLRRTEIQAILENNLFEDAAMEQDLMEEAEHIDLLLSSSEPKLCDEQKDIEVGSNDEEKLYLLNMTTLVHIQTTGEGFDYTIYDAKTHNLIDGGQFGEDEVFKKVSNDPLRCALDTVCEMHILNPTLIKVLDPSILEED